MKKNWKGQTAYKAFALLIACITGITTLLAAIMMIFSIGLRAEYGNQNDTIAELMQEHMVSNYAAYLKESATGSLSRKESACTGTHNLSVTDRKICAILFYYEKFYCI